MGQNERPSQCLPRPPARGRAERSCCRNKGDPEKVTGQGAALWGHSNGTRHPLSRRGRAVGAVGVVQP